jgi:hypothetical protein
LRGAYAPEFVFALDSRALRASTKNRVTAVNELHPGVYLGDNFDSRRGHMRRHRCAPEPESSAGQWSEFMGESSNPPTRPLKRNKATDTPGLRRGGKRPPRSRNVSHYDSDGSFHSSRSF